MSSTMEIFYLTHSLPVTRICINYSTDYNDTLVAKGLNKDFHGSTEHFTKVMTGDEGLDTNEELSSHTCGVYRSV